MGTRKVGVIKHEKYGIEVPLKLDTDSMIFEATWARTTFEDGTMMGQSQRYTERGKDGEEVRDAMLAYIDAQMTMTWEPVIEVVPLSDDAQRDQVRATAACAFALARFWIGRPSVGDMQRVEWDVATEQRAARSRPFYVTRDEATGITYFASNFTLPHRAKPRFGAERIYLPYTDEMWAGLTLIEDRIREARSMLDEMLGTDDALGRVAELGAKVLPNLLAAPGTPGTPEGSA